MKDLSKLPDDLPVPADDGACDHLWGTQIPSVSLLSVSGKEVDLSSCDGTVVIYFYPMIGRPDSPPLVGWNKIPGARGCTPQACSFRDHHAEINSFSVEVYGVSSQPRADQTEATERLRLPFELLNDSKFELTKALQLPTFEYKSTTLIKRLTLIAIGGAIEKVFYPVFPPDKNAGEVIEWLEKYKA